MNSYRQGLRNGVLFNPKLFILEKVGQLGQPWSNLLKSCIIWYGSLHVDVVKEFYSNMVGMKEKTVYVRGKWILFSREKIDQTFNLNEGKNGSKFKKLVKEPDFQKIVDLLTDGKGKWNTTRKNPHESIARRLLTE